MITDSELVGRLLKLNAEFDFLLGELPFGIKANFILEWIMHPNTLFKLEHELHCYSFFNKEVQENQPVICWKQTDEGKRLTLLGKLITTEIECDKNKIKLSLTSSVGL